MGGQLPELTQARCRAVELSSACRARSCSYVGRLTRLLSGSGVSELGERALWLLELGEPRWAADCVRREAVQLISACCARGCSHGGRLSRLLSSRGGLKLGVRDTLSLGAVCAAMSSSMRPERGGVTVWAVELKPACCARGCSHGDRLSRLLSSSRRSKLGSIRVVVDARAVRVISPSRVISAVPSLGLLRRPERSRRLAGY